MSRQERVALMWSGKNQQAWDFTQHCWSLSFDLKKNTQCWIYGFYSGNQGVYSKWNCQNKEQQVPSGSRSYILIGWLLLSHHHKHTGRIFWAAAAAGADTSSCQNLLNYVKSFLHFCALWLCGSLLATLLKMTLSHLTATSLCVSMCFWF